MWCWFGTLGVYFSQTTENSKQRKKNISIQTYDITNIQPKKLTSQTYSNPNTDMCIYID